jgi:hypothetical protein
MPYFLFGTEANQIRVWRAPVYPYPTPPQYTESTPASSRTSENAVTAKFAELTFYEVG